MGPRLPDYDTAGTGNAMVPASISARTPTGIVRCKVPRRPDNGPNLYTRESNAMTDLTRYLLDDQPKPYSHYCHGVRAGSQLWISGTVGITTDGHVPDDVVEQFEIAMAHLDGVLRAAGGEPRHVVKVQVFLTDIADRTKINPVRERYFGEHRPASTLVEVSALVDPRMKVEIEAVAVIE